MIFCDLCIWIVCCSERHDSNDTMLLLLSPGSCSSKLLCCCCSCKLHTSDESCGHRVPSPLGYLQDPSGGAFLLSVQ